LGGIYKCKGTYNCNPDLKMNIRGDVEGWHWVETRRNSAWSDLLPRKVESHGRWDSLLLAFLKVK
jgi:hypothetical protein